MNHCFTELDEQQIHNSNETEKTMLELIMTSKLKLFMFILGLFLKFSNITANMEIFESLFTKEEVGFLS